MKIIFKSIVLLILSLSEGFSSEQKKLKYCDSKPIWKHAAYKNNSNISNFDNIKSSIQNGYCGIELDIIYDDNEKLIYISHDPLPSSKKHKYSLSNLNKLIEGKKVYVWLDWKNTKLLHLSKGLAIIQKSMKGYLNNKDSMVFIETPHILHNEFINFLNEKHNIISLNWLSYGSHKKSIIESIKNIYRKLRAWTYLCVLRDRWVSSPDINILQLCKNNRTVRSIFIFTINEESKAKEAFKEGASVILSDRLK